MACYVFYDDVSGKYLKGDIGYDYSWDDDLIFPFIMDDEWLKSDPETLANEFDRCLSGQVALLHVWLVPYSYVDREVDFTKAIKYLDY